MVAAQKLLRGPDSLMADLRRLELLLADAKARLQGPGSIQN
jgi:hypothetical protein